MDEIQMFVLYNCGLCVNCGRYRPDAGDPSRLGIHDSACSGADFRRHPLAQKIKDFEKLRSNLLRGFFFLS